MGCGAKTARAALATNAGPMLGRRHRPTRARERTGAGPASHLRGRFLQIRQRYSLQEPTRGNRSREALRRNRDYNPRLLPMSEITTSTSGKFFPCNIVFIFIQPEFRNSNERRSKPGVAKTPKRSASKSILVFGILFHWLDVVTQRSDDCRRLRGRMYCLRYGRFAPGSYFIFHCGIRVQVNLVNDKPK